MATKCNVTLNEGSLFFSFDGNSAIEVIVSELPQSIKDKAILHGLKRKLADSYAQAKTSEEAQKCFEGALEALKNEQWNVSRASGPRKPTVKEMWVLAVLEVVTAKSGLHRDDPKVTAKVLEIVNTNFARAKKTPAILKAFTAIRAKYDVKSSKREGLDDDVFSM